MAYETTTVPVEKSQTEIRRLLLNYGAAEGIAQGFAVRMRVRKRPPTPALVEEYQRKRKGRRSDAEERAGWASHSRVLFWSLKARLVAVEEGLETVAEAFLSHIVDPQSGQTVYEAMVERGALKQLGSGERS